MQSPALIAFKSYFENLESADTAALNDIYSSGIHFQDPIHEIRGLERLSSYFEKLNANLASGGFRFTSEDVAGSKVFLGWDLELKLRRPAKVVRASGLSVLVLEDKIISHRDYFDAGELFYEHIPVLGGLIRVLKRKLAG